MAQRWPKDGHMTWFIQRLIVYRLTLSRGPMVLTLSSGGFGTLALECQRVQRWAYDVVFIAPQRKVLQ